MWNRKHVTERNAAATKKHVWRMVSGIMAALLLMTACVTAVFAQEEKHTEITAQDNTGSDAAVQDAAEGDTGSLADLFSGLLSELSENEDISSEDLQDLFSSLLGNSDGESAFAAWIPSFDWTISEEDYGYQLPADVASAFEEATKALLGKTYVPKALLNEQLVSGTNYHILCVGTAVVPDAVPELDVLTIYRDLEGNASVTDVSYLDLNVLYGLLGADPEEAADEIAGGWSVPEEEIAVSLPEKVIKTVREYDEGMEDGYAYLPITVLGTTINNDNLYTTAVLCRLTSDDGKEDTRYEVLFMAEEEDGWVGATYRAPLNLDEVLEQSKKVQEEAAKAQEEAAENDS